LDRKHKFNKDRKLSKSKNQAHRTLSIPLFWRNFTTKREMFISEEQEIQNIQNYNLYCEMLKDED
jgi:hypothetical protein